MGADPKRKRPGRNTPGHPATVTFDQPARNRRGKQPCELRHTRLEVIIKFEKVLGTSPCLATHFLQA